MLNGLKKRWQVNSKELFLILCTFAVTGTVTAWLSKKITEWLFLEKYGLAWWTTKILVLLIGYQVIILLVAFCFRMFPFFWKYEKKILRRFKIMKKETTNDAASANEQRLLNIAVFASGAGSNAQKIIDHFRGSTIARVTLIVCNKPKAGVVDIAGREHIDVLLLNKEQFETTGFAPQLKNYKIDFVVLAGFLWKIPEVLISAFPGKIVNIHPALLPAYGGKGMYGNAVHAAVIESKEKQSGITIHYVDEKYDHGEIIFQAMCQVDEYDTAESLAQKIHLLEHEHYPKVIGNVLEKISTTEIR